MANEFENKVYSLLKSHFDAWEIERNAPYKGFYGTDLCKTEFAIHLDECWKIDGMDINSFRIEVKNQNVAGSVDEKIPDMVSKFWFEKYPEELIIFIISGNGYKKGLKEWFKKCIESPEEACKEQPKEQPYDMEKLQAIHAKKMGLVFFDIESFEEFILEQEDSEKIISEVGRREIEAFAANSTSYSQLQMFN